MEKINWFGCISDYYNFKFKNLNWQIFFESNVYFASRLACQSIIDEEREKGKKILN